MKSIIGPIKRSFLLEKNNVGFTIYILNFYTIFHELAGQ